MDREELRQPFKVEVYTAVAVIFFVLSATVVKFFQTDKVASYHEEIIPSQAISYIKDDNLIALADGDYNLAMPAGGTFVKGIAPMLMIEVDGEYFPLNIADDSILPRQGRQLPLRILFGFTSAHASNTLKYAEKSGDNPVESYKRKAYYYLHVENGYGHVARLYRIQN